VSADPEFSRKASEIVGLYLNPPENAIVLSVDEKPSIQALERKNKRCYHERAVVLFHSSSSAIQKEPLVYCKHQMK
jgi:hypothetical protein